MQGPYLSITLGFQLFLLVGYLLYALFRKYPDTEDGTSLMTWLGGLIGILTIGQVGLLLIVSSAIIVSDQIPILFLVCLDLFGVFLLAYDTLKRRKRSISE